MAIALGMWSMALNCLFLLVLQLAGINIAAVTVFRLYGLSQKGARYKRGSKWVFPVTIAITVAVLVAGHEVVGVVTEVGFCGGDQSD